MAALVNSGMPWWQARDEVLDTLLGEVAAAEREIAVAQGRRTCAIEAARVWALDSVRALDPDLGPVDPADTERVAAIRSQQTFANRSLTLELACALRIPEVSMGSLVHEAEVLTDHHPVTLAALTTGEITYRHADAILDATSTLEPDDCRALEAVLVERAKIATVSSLKAFARRERERTHPRTLVDRHRERLLERRVETEPARDGMMWLSQYLPAAQATAIYNRVTDAAVSIQSPDDPRTLAQLRADVFSALLLDDEAAAVLAEAFPGCDTGGQVGTGARGSSAADVVLRPATGSGTAVAPPGTTATATATATATKPTLRGIRPTVAVTVPVMTLLGRSDDPGHLEGYGPIDPETACDLAARAPSFTRVLTHPETSVVLSVGRDSYAVPADLKRWLHLRDETCRFPGCRRRAARCDIDHVVGWARGGTTDHDNLIHLCRHHHRIKHQTGWTVSTRPGGPGSTSGVTVWSSPTGRAYTDHPALQLPAAADDGRTSDGPGPPVTLPASPEPVIAFPDEPPF